MNGPHSNDVNLPADGPRSLPNGSELLSAYFDGALTAEERAQVDRALAEDGGIRERLAEFSELSGLIRGAGTVSDEELRRAGGSVLRDRILAQVSAGAAGGAGRKRLFSLSRWAIAAGALAATIMVVGLLTVPRVQSVAVNSKFEAAPGGAIMPDAVTTETYAEFHTGTRMSGAAESVRAKEHMDAASLKRNGTAGEKARSSGAPVGAGVVRMAVPVRGDVESPATDPMPLGTLETLPSFAPGKEVDSGELISHLTSVGGEAVLVQYTVVDVRRARGEMEVLLTRHGIRTLPPLEEGEAKSRDLLKDGVDPQTVAIYVEASGDQLMAALDEFKTVPTSVEAIEQKGIVKKGDGGARLSAPGRGRGQTDYEMPAPSKAMPAAAGQPGPASGSDSSPARGPGPANAPASAIPPAPLPASPVPAAAPVSSPAVASDAPAPLADSVANSPAGPDRMRGAEGNRNERQMSYQIPLELSQKEAEQLWREVPKQQTAPTKMNQRYGDYVNQRRSFDAKDKLEAVPAPSRVLILLQEGPAPAAEKN